MQTTVRRKWELTKSVPFIKADTPNGGKATKQRYAWGNRTQKSHGGKADATTKVRGKLTLSRTSVYTYDKDPGSRLMCSHSELCTGLLINKAT